MRFAPTAASWLIDRVAGPQSVTRSSPQTLERQSCHELTVAASPERVLDRLCEIDAYPSWVRELSGARRTGGDHVAFTAEFSTLIQVRQAHWTLAYERAEGQLAWRLLTSNVLADASGLWRAQPVDGGTRLLLETTFALELPVSPGIVNRIEHLFVGTSIRRSLGLLQAQLESSQEYHLCPQ